MDFKNEEVVEVAEVKPKRAYRSKFHYMSADEIKEHKAELKQKNNLKYKENHYDKIKQAQAKYFSSEKRRDYMRDYKRKEELIKKESKPMQDVLDV